MTPAMRIGQGFDVHAYGEGDHIVLGGVAIPFHSGLVAHSDGDVVLHALCDAMLGALALGDIGRYFPDNEDAYENADSRDLLRQIYTLIIERDFRLQNADITIIAQAPKMMPYIEQMRENVALDLDVAINAVSIKATTTEKLGFAGREEGIAAQAVVLLKAGKG